MTDEEQRYRRFMTALETLRELCPEGVSVEIQPRTADPVEVRVEMSADGQIETLEYQALVEDEHGVFRQHFLSLFGHTDG